MKIIAQGAEAIIIRNNEKISKKRIPKLYRDTELDERLRKQRTKKESRIIQKVSKMILVPKVFEVTPFEISMEFIEGKKLADCLDSLDNSDIICEKIGINIAKIHDIGIVHGDLTTSNMLLKDKDLFFIDFGLGYESTKLEDKAVDLHVLKEAINAKHFKNSNKFWASVIKGYKHSKNHIQVLKRLETVEKKRTL